MDTERIVTLVRARIPEIDDVTLAEVEAAITGREPPTVLSSEIGERILEVKSLAAAHAHDVMTRGSSDLSSLARQNQERGGQAAPGTR
jgi:hypothetical protein